MTFLDQLTAWQDELQELRAELNTLSPGHLEQEVQSCAIAVSSARQIAAGRSGMHDSIPRSGQSERRIDLSVRGYLETNACGVIGRTNNAAALLLNFPRHLLVHQPLLVFIKKEERKAFLTAFMELRHSRSVRRNEYLVTIQPVAMEPQLAMLIAERVEDPDHIVRGITWLLAPA
jgi:hypothetical protein